MSTIGTHQAIDQLANANTQGNNFQQNIENAQKNAQMGNGANPTTATHEIIGRDYVMKLAADVDNMSHVDLRNTIKTNDPMSAQAEALDKMIQIGRWTNSTLLLSNGVSSFTKGIKELLTK